ncbi:U3 small nucleolar ribonucleoprotein Mpp10 [Thermoascus aurantiacus ATCC 26904]
MTATLAIDQHGLNSVDFAIGASSARDPPRHILDCISSTPHSFLRPTTELYAASVGSAKHYLDPLAIAVNRSQSARHREHGRKRKRSELDDDFAGHVLQLQQLYVEGFTVGQIWEQAARILDSTRREIKRDLSLTLSPRKRPASAPQTEVELMRFDSDGFEIDNSESHDSSSQSEDVSELSSTSNSIDVDSGSQHENSERGDSDVKSDMDETMDGEGDAIESTQEGHDVYVQDPYGLNDGFFSIDDFNKQSEFFERQDARGDHDEGAASDEEEIDWHVDPLAPGNSISVMNKKTSYPEPEVDAGDDSATQTTEDEGPTFGDANSELNSDSEERASHIHDEDSSTWINTNDIKYADFFAPPPRKASNKKTRALPKTQPEEDDIENEVQRAMEDVRRDLFEDASSDEDVDSVSNDVDQSQTRRSTHEKQRARIADEIRRLEAANVAKKEWMLSGEARAVDRPVNSLIEEDMDFERVGKPVPVVTHETTKSIEELIKRRILAKEFDEVVRRLPGSLPGQDLRRSRLELDDSKPQQSLAELYEADHLRATDPNYIDQKDHRLRREHAEITQLWKEISSQLDSLSNWHYKPKAPQASINVVTDVATITMEEARPTASGAVGTTGALAPQEIYAPGDDGKVGGELILKSGASVAKEEMTREEKIRRRRRQKEKIKKANSGAVGQQSQKVTEKQQLVSDLKKGGVKIIDDRGEMRDVYGHKVTGSNANQGDVLKL